MIKFKNYPRALPVLFLTEMWERFGFYTVQGLLIFYIISVYGFSDQQSYELGAAFTALAYIMPIIGGYVADQVLNLRITIILGNILLAVGYALLMIPGQFVLYLALSLIVTGTGFFKPNISSLLGTFYRENDSGREAGFTIFYMGINVGIIAATLLVGFINRKFGWSASFAIASAGLVIGFITFIAGTRIIDKSVITLKKVKPKVGLNNILANKYNFTLISLALIAIAHFLMQHYRTSQITIWLSAAIIFFLFIKQAFRYPDIQRNKMLALLMLIFLSVFFWALYFQMYLVLNLFIKRNVLRQFNVTIPPISFLAIEPFFLLVLGGLFASLWRRLGKEGKNPSIPLKFALATFLLGLCFAVVLLGIKTANPSALINPLWIVFAYLLVAIGELLLSPIGLSMVTLLAPPGKTSLLMGAWLLVLGLGGELAGIIAEQASVMPSITAPQLTLQIYAHAFTYYMFYGFAASLLILILTPVLNQLIEGQVPSWKTYLVWCGKEK